MNEPAIPPRVRITGPPRRGVPPARTGDIDAETRLGGIYMTSLLREQWWLAMRILATLGLTVCSLPLVFHLAPGLSDVHLLGFPLAWLLLGVAVYPFLVFLGWFYVRRAERNERNFADLMGGAVPQGTVPEGSVPEGSMVEEVAQQSSSNPRRPSRRIGE